jgi:hypothetical protein
MLSQTTTFDATFTLCNPGFEEGVNYHEGINKPLGWKLEQTTAGTRDIGNKTATPAEGYYKYSVWASQVVGINLYQDISLSAGEYVLSGVLHTSTAGDVTNQHLYAKIDDSEPVASATLSYDADNYWIPLSVSFTVAVDNATVRIGAQSTGRGTAAGHFAIDNVSLQKTNVYSSVLPIYKSDPVISTQYYNLQGVLVGANNYSPAKGMLYIVKETTKSGKVISKVKMSK